MQKREAPPSLARSRRGEHLLDRHQRLGLGAGLVMRALRAIAAVFRAAAGLDRQQRAQLHRVGLVVLAVHLLRALDQIGQRQVVDVPHLLQRQPARVESRVRIAQVARLAHGPFALAARAGFRKRRGLDERPSTVRICTEMSEVLSEVPVAQGAPDKGAGEDPAEAFGMHVQSSPPLAWLATFAALSAMVLNQLLLPALNDPARRALLHKLDPLGRVRHQPDGCFGVDRAQLRAARVRALQRRDDACASGCMVGGFGVFVFLPTIAVAVLLERQRTTAQIVLFALGAAQVLSAIVSTSAARAARSALRARDRHDRGGDGDAARCWRRCCSSCRSCT